MNAKIIIVTRLWSINWDLLLFLHYKINDSQVQIRKFLVIKTMFNYQLNGNSKIEPFIKGHL